MFCSSHKCEDRGCTDESGVGADGCLYLRMSAPGFYVASSAHAQATRNIQSLIPVMCDSKEQNNHRHFGQGDRAAQGNELDLTRVALVYAFSAPSCAPCAWRSQRACNLRTSPPSSRHDRWAEKELSTESACIGAQIARLVGFAKA